LNYRRLGNSGLKVSEIGLGSWLTYGESVDTEPAKEIIHHAYDLGINFFDTANAYNQGQAEVVVGDALKDFSRSSYVLATKLFFPMGDSPNEKGLSRKAIIEQCDASLKRLGVDYIDLYQCHRFDEETPVEETLWALNDLVAQGKILYYGVSEWSALQIKDAMNIARQRNLRPMVSNQPIYNMLVRYIEKQVLPVSVEEGLGQVVFSPLAQGILTGKYKPGKEAPKNSRAANDNINTWINSYMKDEVLECIQQLERIAASQGLKLSQLAIAWILRQPGVSSTIVGASRPSQLDENVKAAGVELSKETLEEIDSVLEEINGFVPIW
jgi:voltage-dependent potassium channel beta subunit